MTDLPLPPPHRHGGTYESSPFTYYTESDLLAYGRMVAERCAEICENEHICGQHDDDLGWTGCAATLAAAIRANKEAT